MNLEDKLKNLHLEADYLEAVEDMADEYGAIIMDANADTLRLVGLNLARVLACHGIDGCIVPKLGQRPECERRAILSRP